MVSGNLPETERLYKYRHMKPNCYMLVYLSGLFRFWLGSLKRKSALRACAICGYSYHPAHAQSLIRAFALHWIFLQYLMILFADSEGPDQTAHPRSLINAFAVPTWPESTSSLGRAQMLNQWPYKSVFEWNRPVWEKVQIHLIRNIISLRHL